MWQFDKSVADRFNQEAQQHIPDYDRVIDMCLDIARTKGFSPEINVIDVGSATGNTVDKFLKAGYVYTYGVEASESMIAQSLHKDRIFLSDKFPKMPCEFVMANWTLHFVKQRKEYIQDIYNNMTGGVFVLSDKTYQSEITKKLYYQWKLDNGVDVLYILHKETQLAGVLDTLDVDWYIKTLKETGFSVEVINSRFGFVTFYCEK